MVALGLALLLEARLHVGRVDAALGADDARTAMERWRPDVVVCSLELTQPGEALGLLAEWSHRVSFVIVGDERRTADIAAALRSGALAYVREAAPSEQLVEDVRRAMRGEASMEPRLLAHLRTGSSRPTAREIEVMTLVSRGFTNDRIAAELGLSVKTIESHLRRLFDRYDTANRAELTWLALTEGWIGPG